MRYNREGHNAMLRLIIIVLVTIIEATVEWLVGTTGALDEAYAFPLGPIVQRRRLHGAAKRRNKVQM